MSPHTDAGALLKLAEEIERACKAPHYEARLGTIEGKMVVAILRQAASQGSAGGERSEVQIDDPNMCPNCFGDGYFPKEDLTGDDKCETCNGTGSHIPAAAQGAGKPVAWTNEAQLGFLKDPEWAEAPMAMWGKRTDKYADIPLYASPVPSAEGNSHD